MDLKKLAEPFPADDIEWRIQSSGLSGGTPWARVLAYITARAIMDRLDEVCKPAFWKVRYTHEGGGVMCHLAIDVSEVESEVWVEKSDGAEQTDIEKFKGGLSSALKRAGSVWGIGRYLYKLESGFAECDKNTKKFPNYGKTKDGTAFSWKPPDLPPWALPAETPHEPIEPPLNLGAPVTERDATAAKSTKAPRVTAAQKKMIGMLRKEMGLSDEVYREELFRSYHCRSTTELTRDQAGELISRLEAKRKANIERDVQDTFGDGGKISTLQAMARGHIEKIKVLGEKYQNGEPIVYKNESIPVENLGELEEVVEAMGDEKELERLIIRLEALLSTISF